MIGQGVKTTLKDLKEENYEMQDSFKHYIFSPSITKTRTINGKTYIVRSYFVGGKDFAETMERLAIQKTFRK